MDLGQADGYHRAMHKLNDEPKLTDRGALLLGKAIRGPVAELRHQAARAILLWVASLPRNEKAPATATSDDRG